MTYTIPLTAAAAAPVLEKCMEDFVAQEFSALLAGDIATTKENRSTEMTIVADAVLFTLLPMHTALNSDLALLREHSVLPKEQRIVLLSQVFLTKMA